jgi:hypothetical protein
MSAIKSTERHINLRVWWKLHGRWTLGKPNCRQYNICI